MTAKRIRKNAHKKIDAIFSNSTTAKAYAEDNGFVGVDVSIEWVKKMAVGRSVEYYDNQDGSYTIRIHSNLWYELYHKKELVSLEELNGILADVRAIQKRIESFESQPNWETTVKADMLRAVTNLDLATSDFILSLEQQKAESDGESEALGDV